MISDRICKQVTLPTLEDEEAPPAVINSFSPSATNYLRLLTQASQLLTPVFDSACDAVTPDNPRGYVNRKLALHLVDSMQAFRERLPATYRLELPTDGSPCSIAAMAQKRITLGSYKSVGSN